MQLFTFVYLLLKHPAIEGFWARGMDGESIDTALGNRSQATKNNE